MVNKCVLEDWFHYQITNPLSLIQFSVYIECVLLKTYMMELNTATANLEVLKMIQTKNHEASGNKWAWSSFFKKK